jgi:hypothetical protein
MAMAAGAVMRIAGGITGGIAADKKRDRWQEFMDSLAEPNVRQEGLNWFGDLEELYPRASSLSQRAREDEMTQNLALRERALPGIGQASADAMQGIGALLRGELPPEVLRNFTRAGGASTVGLGMGGSGFGALNTGLFGARGSIGAMQTGMGLLPTLLGTMPTVSAPTTMGLLGQLMTPEQRVNLQMQLRAQKIGMQGTLESMPTALESWSAHLNESGAMLLGGGGAAMGGMGGSGTPGMGGFNTGGGMNAGGYGGAAGGATGGWGGGSLWGGAMV